MKEDAQRKKRISCILLAVLLLLGVLPTAANAETDAVIGFPAAAYKATFTDVPGGKWYTEAVEWCAQNGLAAGKGKGIFDPDGDATRQELAAFMMRFVQKIIEA